MTSRLEQHWQEKYWELFFFLAYAAAISFLVIPEVKWDFDGHDSTLLMSGYRIWNGQVPFRDFYPWINPAPGRRKFRVSLFYVNSSLNLQFTFPGPANMAPKRIKITGIKWFRFSTEKPIRKALIYQLEN
jgi:hypothetical protein